MSDWTMGSVARRASVIAGLAMWGVGCGGGGDGATAPPAPPSVASVTVTLGSTQLIQGGTTSANAVVRSADGTALTGRVVTWSSSTPSVATVDAAGNVSAVGNGSTTISATSEGQIGSATLTVSPPPVATVAVTLAQTRLIVGVSTTATAALTDAAGAALNGRTIEWSSGNPAIAIVNASGTVTAVSTGSVAITATSEGRSGSAQLTVDPPPVASVAVTLAQASIVVGSSTGATAVLRDANGATLTNRALSWTSSNPAIASVSDAGVVSAIAIGSVTIAATSEGKSGTAELTVVPPPVATISVTLAQSVLPVNASTSATAVLRDANGGVLTNRAVTWSSSNTSVATVGTTGLVTALAGGTATITAMSEGRAGSANLTVQQPPVATVTVSGASRVKVGDSYNYSATLRLADGSVVTRPIAWDITDASRASITQGGVLTALRPGTFTIRLIVDGATWTSNYTAYDWEALNSSGNRYAFIDADITITNRLGTVEYPELVISCGATGYFFVWVRTPHVITANGVVALSFDNGSPFTQVWDELSPNFNTLWKPGPNATVKAFSLDIERARVFGFAFGEYQGQAKATQFRVGGLGSLLPPLLAACPNSAVTASADLAAADLASQRAIFESHWPRRSRAGSSADAAKRQQQPGPITAPISGLAEVLGAASALPAVHSQQARRQR